MIVIELYRQTLSGSCGLPLLGLKGPLFCMFSTIDIVVCAATGAGLLVQLLLMLAAYGRTLHMHMAAASRRQRFTEYGPNYLGMMPCACNVLSLLPIL